MRLSNYKAPWSALVLALAFLVLSFALVVISNWLVWPDWGSTLLQRILWFLYVPAGIGMFLFLPDSSFDKGSLHPIQIPVVFLLFALIQWYLIFLAGIGIYRWFHRKHDEKVSAV